MIPAEIGKKVHPVLPVHLPHIDQANIRLVYESRWLEGMVAPFAQHAAARNQSQFSINDWHQTIECFAITARPGTQQVRNIRRTGFRHRAGIISPQFGSLFCSAGRFRYSFPGPFPHIRLAAENRRLL